MLDLTGAGMFGSTGMSIVAWATVLLRPQDGRVLLLGAPRFLVPVFRDHRLLPGSVTVVEHDRRQTTPSPPPPAVTPA